MDERHSDTATRIAVLVVTLVTLESFAICLPLRRKQAILAGSSMNVVVVDNVPTATGEPPPQAAEAGRLAQVQAQETSPGVVAVRIKAALIASASDGALAGRAVGTVLLSAEATASVTKTFAITTRPYAAVPHGPSQLDGQAPAESRSR